MSTRQNILDRLFFGRDPLKDFPAGRFPTDLQGWHSRHEYLTRAIAQTRPAIVVEVGVWKGASVVTMAKEIQRLKLDAVVIAIDTWLGSSEHYLWEKFTPTWISNSAIRACITSSPPISATKACRARWCRCHWTASTASSF